MVHRRRTSLSNIMINRDVVYPLFLLRCIRRHGAVCELIHCIENTVRYNHSEYVVSPHIHTYLRQRQSDIVPVPDPIASWYRCGSATQIGWSGTLKSPGVAKPLLSQLHSWARLFTSTNITVPCSGHEATTKICHCKACVVIIRTLAAPS
jgi:hypothetical protein